MSPVEALSVCPETWFTQKHGCFPVPISPFRYISLGATVGLFVLEESKLKVSSSEVLYSKGRNPPILPWSLMLSPPEKD